MYGTNKKVSMSARKKNSTNYANEIYWKKNCGIKNTLAVIEGRWKINILAFLLNEEKLRYSELKKRLVGISERMLSSRLKELEKDGLIKRTVYPQVPPKVEYELTTLGSSLEKILVLLEEWGKENLSK